MAQKDHPLIGAQRKQISLKIKKYYANPENRKRQSKKLREYHKIHPGHMKGKKRPAYLVKALADTLRGRKQP
jgi:hypothetical protein